MKPNHDAFVAEQEKFLILIEQASYRLPEATLYREFIKQWNANDLQEIAYRIADGRALAALFARERAGRWLGVFAHFIPQINPSYLPLPGDVLQSTYLLNPGATPAARYAFHAVDQINYNVVIRESIRALLDQSFDEEDTALLAHISLALTGCCTLLEEIADIHLLTMKRCLDVRTQEFLGEVEGACSQGQHQLFCNFWEFPIMHDYPQLLAKTVSDFRRGRRSGLSITAPPVLDFFSNN